MASNNDKTKNKPPVYKMIDDVVKPVENYKPPEGDLPNVTHEGVLKIGEQELRCYVLSNGMRIFDVDDVKKFFNQF